MQKQKILNLTFNPQRREALENLKNLGILGLGGVALAHLHTLDLNLNENLSELSTQILSSNVPSQIASLPLKAFHFNFDLPFEILLKQERNEHSKAYKMFIPLLSSEFYDESKNYSFYLTKKIKKFNHNAFLAYHYDSLASLIKDLEAQNFFVKTLSLYEDIKELLYYLILDPFRYKLNEQNYIEFVEKNTQKIKDIELQSYYKLDFNALKNPNAYKIENSKYTKTIYELIIKKQGSVDALRTYHLALTLLEDLQKELPNKQEKAKKLLKCLEFIGKDNIKTMYIGSLRQEHKENYTPIIGRLATTMIMKDGLFIG